MPKARAKRKSRTTSKTKPLPGWIWLVTGLVIGLSATFLPKLNEKFSSNSKHANAVATTDVEITEDSERTYEFYEILPQLEVLVDENTETLSPNQSKSKPAASKPETYVLQVGSFKSNREADALKAQLALLGVETNIEKVTVDKQQWYRVRIGPSNDLAHLQSVQTRLKNVKIKAILY